MGRELQTTISKFDARRRLIQLQLGDAPPHCVRQFANTEARVIELRVVAQSGPVQTDSTCSHVLELWHRNEAITPVCSDFARRYPPKPFVVRQHEVLRNSISEVNATVLLEIARSGTRFGPLHTHEAQEAFVRNLRW